MKVSIEVLSDGDLEKIHKMCLRTLENPGMRIDNEKMLQGLKKAGATVDLAKKIVRFPEKLIENTINLMKKDIKEGRKPVYLNGVTSPLTGVDKVKAKFGNGSVSILNMETRETRVPTEDDLISCIRVGEILEEVAFVGNPVAYLMDKNGNMVEPKMQRIKTAAIVAKNTTKPATTQVWNAKELDYLIEIGIVVRGSEEEYRKNLCFITAKETVSPLTLQDEPADVMLALAARKLPVTVIPMPISGISSPVNAYGNIIIGNSEILGTACAIKSLYPEAPVVGGVISGSLDMATGSVNFAVPEAILQDLGIAEVHNRLYGFDFGIGGYTDGKYPGIQNAFEKTFRYSVLAFSGRFAPPVGLVNWGKAFCIEQALIDIEFLKNICKLLKGIELTDTDEVLGSIRNAGAGGNYLTEEYTLRKYRNHLSIPELFDHALSSDVNMDIESDILVKAISKKKDLLSRDSYYEISRDKAKEIDDIVKRAEKNLKN